MGSFLFKGRQEDIGLGGRRDLISKPISLKIPEVGQVFNLNSTEKDNIIILTAKLHEATFAILVNTQTGKVIKKAPLRTKPVSKQLLYSQEKLFFTLGGSDLNVKVWSYPNFAEVNTFRHNHLVLDMELLESTAHLLTCGNFPGIQIWDLKLEWKCSELRNRENSPYNKICYVRRYNWVLAVDQCIIHVFDWGSRLPLYAFAAHGILPITLIDYCSYYDSFMLQYKTGETHRVTFNETEGFKSIWKVDNHIRFVKESFIYKEKFLVVVLFDVPAQILNCETGHIIGRMPIFHNEKTIYLRQKKVFLIYNAFHRKCRLFNEEQHLKKAQRKDSIASIFCCAS